ncbi:MAG: universal stress protein [Sulfitobacter sp.]
MAYKSVFTVLYDPEIAGTVLAQAADLAQAMDAHLEVMCIGLERSPTSYYEVGINAAIVQATIEQAQAKAEALENDARQLLAKRDLRWNITKSAAVQPDVGRPVGRFGRFSDLAILPLPYGKKANPDAPIVVEAALFDAGCPVLVVPDDVKTMGQPKRVVIGWNESAEALHAIRAALPLLMGAESVHIAVIDPPTHGPERSDPGGPLAIMLARHGVDCEIAVLAKTGGPISAILSRHVKDTGADMLVMGAYGHSRFREAILGGATRNLLEHAKVPVFMAH